jgi:hypothetical protein
LFQFIVKGKCTAVEIFEEMDVEIPAGVACTTNYHDRYAVDAVLIRTAVTSTS